MRYVPWFALALVVLVVSPAAQAGDVLYDVPPALAALDTSRDVEALDDAGLSEIRGMRGISCSQCRQLMFLIILSMLNYEPPVCPPCPDCGSLMDGYTYTYYSSSGLFPISDGYWYCSGGSCMHMTSPP